MDVRQWSGLAVVGVLAAAWNYVKQTLNFLRNLVVVTHHVEYWGYREIMMQWLDENISFVNCGARSYVTKLLDSNDRRRVPIGAWNRVYGTHLAFYKRRVPIVITVAPDLDTVDITYIKGTFPIDTLVRELVTMQKQCVDAELTAGTDLCYLGSGFWLDHVWGSLSDPMRMSGASNGPDKSSGDPDAPDAGIAVPSEKNAPMASLLNWRTLKHNMFRVTAGDVESNTRIRPDDEALSVRRANRERWLTRMYLTPKQLEVIDEIKFWMQSREWYRRRGIVWRRSMVLHGPPGTGKSSLAYAIATALDVPIRIFHVDTMTDKDFVSNWRSHTSSAVIHLLEDFDAVFDGRTNRFRNDMNNALSFDCLLNALDGVELADGIITIITTNHPDAIDSALLRPGRTDTHVAFGPLDMRGKLHIGKIILPHMSDAALIEFFTSVHPEDATGAEIQELCIKEALRQYWSAYRDAENQLEA